MELNNRFSILSSPQNESFLEEEQSLSDHAPKSTDLYGIYDKHLEDKPSVSSLSLCDMCYKIFSVRELLFDHSYPHQPSYESLMKAVRQRCYICSLLLENLITLSTETSWHTEPGSEMQQWLFYSIYFIFGDYIISFQHKDAESSKIKVLDLTISALWVLGRVAIERPGQSTWSSESKEATSQWLQESIAKDKSDTSTSTSAKFLPTRLLHIALAEGGEYWVKLCQGTDLSQDTQYFTLSHRWGHNMFRLLTHNFQDLMHKIHFEVLPMSFQHAIMVTSDLGYKYLWIDSLCIIQDSPEDWLKEGIQMASIYKNAMCNISATASKDSYTGLFRSRNIETFLPLEVNVNWSQWGDLYGNPEGYIMVKEDWFTSVEDAPLSARGWVFQERLLSPRIIHFGARQLFWEAESNGGNEQWPHGIPFEADGCCMNDLLLESWHSLINPRHSLYGSSRDWDYLVENYNKRKFTYDTDKLAAISGIANEIQKVTGDEYLAGLWKQDLLHQLLWNVEDPEHSNRIKPYTAPTWSWASINGTIMYDFGSLSYGTKELPDFQSSYVSRLREAKTLPILGKGTGPVKAGILRLHGPLRQARLVQGKLKGRSCSPWAVGGKKRMIYFLPDVAPPGELNKSASLVHVQNYLRKIFNTLNVGRKVYSCVPVHVPTQSVFLLPIYYASCRGKFITIGLSLIPTDSIRGQFQRMGLFFTLNQSSEESILSLSCDIDSCYHEVNKGGANYTVSIV